MIGIWKHISVDIKVYWPIYVNRPKFRSIYARNRFLKIFIYQSKNKKIRHISVEIWFFEKFHISVNMKLTYIGQYMNFNIDRYMVTYSGSYWTVFESERSWGIKMDGHKKWKWTVSRFESWLFLEIKMNSF